MVKMLRAGGGPGTTGRDEGRPSARCLDLIALRHRGQSWRLSCRPAKTRDGVSRHLQGPSGNIFCPPEHACKSGPAGNVWLVIGWHRRDRCRRCIILGWVKRRYWSKMGASGGISCYFPAFVPNAAYPGPLFVMSEQTIGFFSIFVCFQCCPRSVFGIVKFGAREAEKEKHEKGLCTWRDFIGAAETVQTKSQRPRDRQTLT